jgi:hypothetical protein
MKFEYTNNIKCTKEEAWSLIMDFERRSEWIHFIETTKFTDKKEGFVGSSYVEKFVFLGFHLNITYKIIDYKDHVFVKSKCTMPPFYPIVDVICNDIPNSNFVQCTLAFDISLGPLSLVPKSLIKKQVDAIIQPLVDNFIHILESETSLN